MLITFVGFALWLEVALLTFHSRERSLFWVGLGVVANAHRCPQLFPPFCTPSGSLPHMDFLVPPQIFLQPVPFPTHRAFISPTPGVQRLVSNKVFLLSEAFPTLGAFARSHPDVDCLVPEEVGLLIEGLLAFGTFVRLLPGVDPLVPHKV